MCRNKKVDEEATCKDYLQVQQEIPQQDKTAIQTLGCASESAGKVHQTLLQHPIIDTYRCHLQLIIQPIKSLFF